MTTKRIRPRSSSTGRKRLSPGSISSNITAGSQKQTSSAANRNPPKPNMRRVPWNGSPSRRNRAEPPSAPSRGKAPSRIHRDRGPTVRSGFLSAESGANSVQVLPVSLLPWPARFSGLDSRRGRCLAETPAERLRFSGGRDSKTGSGARTHVALRRTLAFRVGRRDAMGQAARRWHHRRCVNRWSAPMPQPNDLSRSLVALDQDSTIIAVVEMSQSSWLVAGMLPGIERQPCKKLEPNPERLLALLHRWRDEAVKAGRQITRIALAFEAGRDGFWLARWLRAHGVEAHVIHPSSVAVSREHRRAKTDRLDTELLKRGFLGWLRGERGHCTMARIPTIAEEDAKRPNRERECLVRERTRIVNRMKGTLARLGIRNFKPTLRKAAERVATLHTPEGSALPPNVSAELQRNMARLGVVVSQIKEIEGARQKRLEQEPETEPHAMVRHLARVVGIGVETADMLVNEVLSRPMRDRKAVARYAGLTGSPDESGAKRREQGLAKAGNARVRRGMIQLAWRFLRFQKESALARWYRARTADSRIGTRKTMIVALARKLVIALWRFVTAGETLEGVILRPAG